MNFRKFSSRSLLRFGKISGDHFSGVKASLARYRDGFLAHWFPRGHMTRLVPTLKLRPERISGWMSAAFLLLIVAVTSYWMMRIAQIPFPPVIFGKGVVFYEAGSAQAIRGLFGEKTFDTSRLALRGVVITGSHAGANQGIALIEVDGKSAEAISVGEMVPPGIRLEKIDPDGVVLNYQGKEISLQHSFETPAGKTR